MQFSLLWTVCGAFLFAVGLLASVVFAGEYGAPLGAFAAVLMYSFVVDWPGVERYLMDIHDVMSGAGMSYFNSDTALLTGPLPWRALAVVLLAAFILMALAARITQKQDF